MNRKFERACVNTTSDPHLLDMSQSILKDKSDSAQVPY